MHLPRFAILAVITSTIFAATSAYATQKPIDVEAVAARKGNVPRLIYALGSLTAAQEVELSSQSAGVIANIYFDDGQAVEKGMPILQLDNAAARASYDSAAATYTVARNKYQRSKQLINEGISRQALDTLKAQAEAAKATMNGAQVAFEQKQIKAPFSGALGAFQVHMGQYVSPGQVLVSLVNKKVLKANFTVPAAQLALLKHGQQVRFTVSSYPKREFSGEVNYISPTVDPSTRSIAVEAIVQNPKQILSPGMFIRLKQQVGEIKQAVLLPQVAVNSDIKGYYVYRVDGNKVAKVYIKLGVRTRGQIQITSGLRAGQRVVSAGVQKLQDGSLVHVVAAKKTKRGRG